MRGPDPIEWVGWLATAVFVGSYRSRDPRTLRWIQAAGAVLWIVYGVARQATPVVMANLLVAGVAVYSSWPRSVRSPISSGNKPGQSHTS